MIAEGWIIIAGALISIDLYGWLFYRAIMEGKVKLSGLKNMPTFLIENPGTPFIAAFVFLLLASAVYFSAGNQNLANVLSEYAYYAILIGVVLQAISLRRKKE